MHITQGEQIFFLEFHRRLSILQRLLDITDTRWNCYAALIQDRRPISEASLAEYLQAPKTTVRSSLEIGIRRGFLERLPRGMQVTSAGAEILMQALTETHEIVLGIRTGYSDATLDHSVQGLSSVRRRQRLQQLKEIQFSPQLRLPVLSLAKVNARLVGNRIVRVLRGGAAPAASFLLLIS